MRYKVGDRVKVKTWNQLAEGNEVTFVSNNQNDNCQKVIEKGKGFVYPVMEYFCGKEVEISYVDEKEEFYLIHKEDGYDGCKWEDWMFEDAEQTTSGNKILIKYHVPDMTPLENIDGEKSDWIDLRTAQDEFVEIFQYELISLGVSMQLPAGKEAHIIPRSSTPKNFGVIQANSYGMIDEKFYGDNDIWRFPAICFDIKHIYIEFIEGIDPMESNVEMIPYENGWVITKDEYNAHADEIVHMGIKKMRGGTFIPKDSRICQFRLYDHQEPVTFRRVDQLGNEDRGGIGSTGTE